MMVSMDVFRRENKMQNTNRRVVVTGIGIISPVGCTTDEFWSSISSGVSGIGELTSFDPGDSKFRLAAEVKGFDAAARLDKLTAKKHDSYVLTRLRRQMRLCSKAAFWELSSRNA